MKYYYITTLSNWILGYDKYKRIYSKTNLSESKYPKDFYLLKEEELEIGLNKAINLINKLNILNNKVIRIETILNNIEKNIKNGLGWIIKDQNWISVNKVYIFEDNEWLEISIEDITAQAYQLNNDKLLPYQKLKPRTLSLLPVARACQASCKFCFSESSISFDQKNNIVDLVNLEKICQNAKLRGCERFVITGGGEPTLIKFEHLLNIIKISRKYFNKTILITNGLFLSEKEPNIIIEKTNALIEAGLNVLALSYHHYKRDVNNVIMNKEVKTDYLLNVLNENKLSNKLNIRLICVLQKEGINNEIEIENYVNFAIKNNVKQICFKELYVSSTNESLYTEQKENQYCKDNQITLSVLINYLSDKAIKINELPWGSPVYLYKEVKIAAYTEPSVGWERQNGIARSWNIMADGKCFASLEDKNSIMEFENEL